MSRVNSVMLDSNLNHPDIMAVAAATWVLTTVGDSDMESALAIIRNYYDLPEDKRSAWLIRVYLGSPANTVQFLNVDTQLWERRDFLTWRLGEHFIMSMHRNAIPAWFVNDDSERWENNA